MTHPKTDPADPKAGEGTPGYGDQGPASAGGPSNPNGEVTGSAGQEAPQGTGRGLSDDADEDPAGAPSTEGGMQHEQDGAERQTTLGGGSSSTEE